MLFVIYTPLQLLNCFEFYCSELVKGGQFRITVVLVSKPERLDSLASAVEKLFGESPSIFKVADFAVRDCSYSKVLGYRLLARWKISSILKIGYSHLVHSSVDKALLRYMSNKGNFEKRVMIDDGLATYNFLNYEPAGPEKTGLRFYLKSLESMVFGFPKKYDISKYILFSIFSGNNESKFLFKIKNNYLGLKKMYSKNQMNVSIDTVHFVGQPLSELGLVDKSDYVSYLSSFCEKFASVEYYPHPGESFEKLILLENEGLKVVYNVFGYELYLIERGVCPSSIYTFYSSASVVLSELFSDFGVGVYAVSLSEKNGFYRVRGSDKFDGVYKELARLGVSIV